MQKTSRMKMPLLCLIGLLCFFAVIVSSPGIVSAQDYTIAIIKSRNLLAYNQALEGINAKLKEKKVKTTINMYELEETKNTPDELVARIKRLNPDLIISIGTEATKLIIDSFKTTPIVFTMVLDSVESGLTQNYEGTNSNYTGVLLMIPLEVQFRKLKEVMPDLKKIGLLYEERKKTKRIEYITEIARQQGLSIVAESVGSLDRLPDALDAVLENADVLWAEVDPFIYNLRTAKDIILKTFKQKKPFMAFSSHYVEAGALMALECNYHDIGIQTGTVIAEILRGKNPGTYPITFPEKSYIAVNLNTAHFVGINMPQSVLREAEKVFGS